MSRLDDVRAWGVRHQMPRDFDQLADDLRSLLAVEPNNTDIGECGYCGRGIHPTKNDPELAHIGGCPWLVANNRWMAESPAVDEVEE